MDEGTILKLNFLQGVEGLESSITVVGSLKQEGIEQLKQNEKIVSSVFI